MVHWERLLISWLHHILYLKNDLWSSVVEFSFSFLKTAIFSSPICMLLVFLSPFCWCTFLRVLLSCDYGMLKQDFERCHCVKWAWQTLSCEASHSAKFWRYCCDPTHIAITSDRLAVYLSSAPSRSFWNAIYRVCIWRQMTSSWEEKRIQSLWSESANYCMHSNRNDHMLQRFYSSKWNRYSRSLSSILAEVMHFRITTICESVDSLSRCLLGWGSLHLWLHLCDG